MKRSKETVILLKNGFKIVKCYYFVSCLLSFISFQLLNQQKQYIELLPSSASDASEQNMLKTFVTMKAAYIVGIGFAHR